MVSVEFFTVMKRIADLEKDSYYLQWLPPELDQGVLQYDVSYATKSKPTTLGQKKLHCYKLQK